ncbi:MAG TPA: PEGA domain-containing protein [Polyangiaceae bacterium]|nr:PEGA domain-containing protein [Polyangiaceae bacterium]
MKALLFRFSAVVVGLALATGSAAQAQPIQQIQQAPSTSTALDDKARELFLEGVKASEKSQWAKAHAAFLAAWSLKEHYQIAGNLGIAEAKLGKWRDAATHLSLYLRQAPKEKVAERRSAEELLAQARAKVGAILVRVEPAGAEVFVDGKAVGKAPLAGEVFVEPGARVIEAKLAGYEAAKKDVSAGAGSAQEVELRLAPPGAKGSGEPSKLSGAPAERRGMAEEKPKGAAQGGPPKTQPVGTDEVRGPRKALIITGIATSAATVTAGLVFALVSNAHASDAEEQRTTANQLGSRDPCLTGMYSEQCEAHESTLAAKDAFANLSVFSFVIGGVLGAGTAVYALAAPPSKSTASAQIAPVVTSRGGGLVMVGRW